MSANASLSPTRWPVLATRLVENGELLFHQRQRRVDLGPVRAAVRRARKGVADDVLAHAGGVDEGVDAGDPLLGQRGALGIGRDQGRAVERSVDVGCDGLRLEELEIAVSHHGDLAEGWMAPTSACSAAGA